MILADEPGHCNMPAKLRSRTLAAITENKLKPAIRKALEQGKDQPINQATVHCGHGLVTTTSAQRRVALRHQSSISQKFRILFSRPGLALVAKMGNKDHIPQLKPC